MRFAPTLSNLDAIAEKIDAFMKINVFRLVNIKKLTMKEF